LKGGKREKVKVEDALFPPREEKNSRGDSKKQVSTKKNDGRPSGRGG